MKRSLFKSLAIAALGLVLAAVAVVALALLQVVGVNPDSPQSILRSHGPVAERQLWLFLILFWAVIVIFVLVGGWLLYTVVKYRRRPGQGIPEQMHGNTRLEIAWTVIPALLLAALAVPTVAAQFYITEPPDGADQMRIEVRAHQWWWAVEYPDTGVVTANEIRVPVGKAVVVDLTAEDVLHSFWIPKLAGKIDVVPGKTTSMWFQADEPGEYYGQCAEFCGESHAWMKFRVIAESPEAYEAWTQAQLADAPAPATEAETAGAQLFITKACIACHKIHGVPAAAGVIGPNLTHVAGRTMLAAGMLENNEENLRAWITDPADFKPGNIMNRDGLAYNNPQFALSDEDISNLTAYIMSLK